MRAVHAAAVNPVDFKYANRRTGKTFPIVAGNDVAGVVSAVGEGDAGSLKVGDSVFGLHIGGASGSFAEFAVIQAKYLGKMHESASFEEMASAPIAVGTAAQAIERLELTAGQKVFITGGAGGVGCRAIQIAKNIYGLEVATTSSAAKADFVKELGADRVVDYRNEDAGEVLSGWADAVFASAADSPMCQKVVKKGGMIITIVEYNDPALTPHFVQGSTALMDTISGCVSSGKVKIIIDTVYSLSDGVEALKHVERGRAKGKVVIKVQ